MKSIISGCNGKERLDLYVACVSVCVCSVSVLRFIMRKKKEGKTRYSKEKPLPIDRKGKTPYFSLNCKELSPIKKYLVGYEIMKISYTYSL